MNDSAHLGAPFRIVVTDGYLTSSRLQDRLAIVALGDGCDHAKLAMPSADAWIVIRRIVKRYPVVGTATAAEMAKMRCRWWVDPRRSRL
jgi:hypothetical protein